MTDNQNTDNSNPIPHADDIRKQSLDSPADVQVWVAGMLETVAAFIRKHTDALNEGRVIRFYPVEDGVSRMWELHGYRITPAVEQRGYKVDVGLPISGELMTQETKTVLLISLPKPGSGKVIAE